MRRGKGSGGKGREMKGVCWRCGLIAYAVFLFGCNRSNSTPWREVVIYTSVDQPYCAPILAEFERRNGIHVIVKTDAEATKSVGLAERLRAEKDHPQADVWWSNEIFLTINLAEDGVLAVYDSASAADVPPQFKDPEHRWASSGMRVRVLVTNHTAAPLTKLED